MFMLFLHLRDCGRFMTLLPLEKRNLGGTPGQDRKWIVP